MSPEPAREFGVLPGGADDAGIAGPSILDDLRAELSADIAEDEEVTLAVPGRDGYAVRFSTVIDHHVLKSWRRKCMPKGARADSLVAFDELKFACIVIGNQALAIVRRGEDVVDADVPVLFGADAFLEMVGAIDAAGAIRKFYGRDSHVIVTGTKVLEAAGYADDVLEAEEAPGPTQR